MQFYSLLSLVKIPSIRLLKAIFIWPLSLLLWGVVLFLLYNLLYGKDGVLEYVSISNEIASISNTDKISKEERERMKEKFKLVDQDGKQIDLWKL